MGYSMLIRGYVAYIGIYSKIIYDREHYLQHAVDKCMDSLPRLPIAHSSRKTKLRFSPRCRCLADSLSQSLLCVIERTFVIFETFNNFLSGVQNLLRLQVIFGRLDDQILLCCFLEAN